MHELRLFIEKSGEIMPGVPKMDLPCRPLIVHSGNYATTYDMMDNFYMLWQRKSSIFTGEFACCRLGHKRKGKDAYKLRFVVMTRSTIGYYKSEKEYRSGKDLKTVSLNLAMVKRSESEKM